MSQHQRSGRLSSESHIPGLHPLHSDISGPTIAKTFPPSASKDCRVSALCAALQMVQSSGNLMSHVQKVTHTPDLYSQVPPPTHTYTAHNRTYGPLLRAVALSLVGLVGRWGDAAALRVHPAVHVVGDVASGDATHGAHGHGQLLASLQHLQRHRRGTDSEYHASNTSNTTIKDKKRASRPNVLLITVPNYCWGRMITVSKQKQQSWIGLLMDGAQC